LQCKGQSGYYYCFHGVCVATSSCTFNEDCNTGTYVGGVCVPGPSTISLNSYCLAGPQCTVASPANCTAIGGVCHATGLSLSGPDGVCLVEGSSTLANVPTFIHLLTPRKAAKVGNAPKKLLLNSTSKGKKVGKRFNATAFSFAPSSKLVQVLQLKAKSNITVTPFPTNVPIFLYVFNFPPGKYAFKQRFSVVSRCKSCGGTIVKKKKKLLVPKNKPFSGILKFNKGTKKVRWLGFPKSAKGNAIFTFATVTAVKTTK